MSNNIPSYQDLQNLVVKLESENKILQLENRFNLLLKASEDMITIHKLNGEYTYYNGPSCYAITPKDVVGKKIDDLFDKEISTKLLKTFKKVQKTGKSETIEVLIDWLGEKKWFSEYIYPLKNEEGKVVELAKVCRDIHKRKIAEQIIEKQNKEKELQLKELEASKQKVETTLKLLEKIEYSKNEASKMAKIGFWDFDSVNQEINWSDYIYHIFGLDSKYGPLKREKFVTFFDKPSQEKLFIATKNLTEKGVSYDIELKIINLRNEEVWIRNVVQPIYNQQNIIVGRRGIMQNITESKQAQFNLEFSRRKIETSLELVKSKEYSLSESSRIAKIGHWEYDIALDSFIWSDYIYEIYGLDILDKIPQRKDLVSLYDKESQKKLIKATIDLTKAGTSYDIELRLIHSDPSIAATPATMDVLEDSVKGGKGQFFKEFGLAVGQYSVAYQFIKEHKLWYWLIIPCLLNLLAFVVVGYVSWVYTGDLLEYFISQFGISGDSWWRITLQVLI